MTRPTLSGLSSSIVSSIAVILPLLFLYCSTSVPSACASKLDDLKNLRSRCFAEAAPCILLSDHAGSYGCAQCDAKVKEAPLIEFVTRSELTQWIGKYPTRVVMMPQFLFFDQSVLSALESADNVAALVVYSGESPLLEGNLLPNETYPYPPLQTYSDDLPEPNARSNYYFTSSSLPSESTETGNGGLIEFAEGRSMRRNIPGDGSNFYFFPFNIFHISGDTAGFIRNESKRFRDDFIVIGSNSPLLKPRARTAPQYKLKSTGEMYACRSTPAPSDNETQDSEGSASADVNPINLVTSQRCLEAKTCLPVGSHSVWSSMGQVMNDTDKVLAITAPIDSMAFFPDLAFGASAEVSSLAVLMAVSEAVSRTYRERGVNSSPPTILPIFFAWNSEAWGYAGSSRFLQDLNDLKNCTSNQDGPVCSQFKELLGRSPKLRYLQDASFTFLNLGQLISPEWFNNRTRGSGNSLINVTYELHYSDFNCALDKIDNPEKECSVVDISKDSDFPTTLKSAFETNGDPWLDEVQVSFNEVREVPEFPLDATHSIFRYRRNSSVFSLTTYTNQFNNKYYHSIYDNKSLTTYATLANDTQRTNGRVPLYIAAQAITDAVISYIFPNSTTSQPVNNSQIDDLIHCLTTNNWASCRLSEEFNTSSTPIISNGDMKGGNHAGSFFDWDRSKDASRSMTVKVDFIRNFLAYHNRYDNVNESDELLDCTTSSECDSYRDKLYSDSADHNVQCIRKKCVVSDTYLHDAFGTGIDSTDKDRTEFVFAETADSGLTNPQKGAWTESVWDQDLSLCAFVEDTTLYGGLILTAGIVVFVLSLLLTIAFDRYMTKSMQPYEEDLLALTRPVEALP